MCDSNDAMIVRKGSRHNFDKQTHKRITIAEKIGFVFVCRGN